MKCTICKEEVVLVPSARERAQRYGGKPADYTRLFPEHNACVLLKRANETAELVQRLTEGR